MKESHMIYGAVAVIVVSSLLYHIIQKSTPTQVNPLVAMFVTYAVAALLCVILYQFYPNSESVLGELRKLNWTSFALAGSILGIELGFLYAYRIGGNVSTASLLSSSLTFAFLIPIGILMFHEKFTLTNAAGFVLCTIGIVMAGKH